MGTIEVGGIQFGIHFRHARKKDGGIGSSIPVEAVTTVVVIAESRGVPLFVCIENVILQPPDQFSRRHARHYAIRKAAARGPLWKIAGFLTAYYELDPPLPVDPVPAPRKPLDDAERARRIAEGDNMRALRAKAREIDF